MLDRNRKITLPAAGEDEPRRRGPGRPSRSNAELLDISLDLFSEHGFEGTSIDAICATAGMAKRTVYARYGDKEQLFRAALQRAIEQWIVPIETLRAVESGDVEESLQRIARILVTNIMCPAGQRLMRLTNAVSGRMPEIGAYSVRYGTAPTLEYLSALFSRNLQVANPDRSALAFLHLVVGGAGNSAAWGAVMEGKELDDYTQYCVKLFLHGLLREAGSGAGQDTPVLSRAEIEAENLRLKKLLAETMLKLDEARGNPASE